MAENDHGLSRNPNVCASCSSMADGMGETTILPQIPKPNVELPPVAQPVPPPQDGPCEEIVVEWTSGRLLKR